MSEQPPEEGDGTQVDERISAIEAEQQRQGGMLEQLLAKAGGAVSHQSAQQRTERRLDSASTVQEQVRAELDRAQREAAASQAAEQEKTERAQLAADVARLKEQPPRAPVPRRTKLLGWGEPS